MIFLKKQQQFNSVKGALLQFFLAHKMAAKQVKGVDVKDVIVSGGCLDRFSAFEINPT